MDISSIDKEDSKIDKESLCNHDDVENILTCYSIVLGVAAVATTRPSDGAYPAAFAPITTAQTMVAKVSWPAGVPTGHEGVYGNFEYPEPAAYAAQNVYSHY